MELQHDKTRTPSSQCRVVDTIENLGFGVIERLLIQDGVPTFEIEPRIVQTIKLDNQLQKMQERVGTDTPLKIPFDRLFAELRLMGEGTVDIHVQHGLPFRLTREFRAPSGHWRCDEQDPASNATAHVRGSARK